MPDLQAPHVVVLDDSPALARALGGVFSGAGYRVSTLTDCFVDPAKVLRMLPDLVVLDLQCGAGLRGMQILRDLRADPAGWNLPVIVSPTIAWLDERAFAPELLALRAELLPDPFTMDDLLAAARAAVERAQDVRGRSDAVRDRLHHGMNKLPPL